MNQKISKIEELINLLRRWGFFAWAYVFELLKTNKIILYGDDKGIKLYWGDVSVKKGKRAYETVIYERKSKSQR